MHIDNAKALARDLMGKHDLLRQGWNFEFNNRKGAFGVCDHNKKTIYLSRYLTVQRPVIDVENTILHEIAHAIAGLSNGHNARWQSIHISIGGDGRRCSDSTNINIDYLYSGTCDCVGKTFKAHRLGSTKVYGSCTNCRISVTWTDTRTGVMTYRGEVVSSARKSSVYA